MKQLAGRWIVVAPLLVLVSSARADDAALAKQRQTAEANCRSLQVSSFQAHESQNLLIYGTLPAARLKALASSLEKHYAVAAKALQYEPDEPPWAGKLTVYVFA